jgi:hypothetical protein
MTSRAAPGRDSWPAPFFVAADEQIRADIVQLRKEIQQSQHALLTGDERGTVAEASREISDAVAAGVENAGAIVGQRRAARATGRPAPAIEIPISHGAPRDAV